MNPMPITTLEHWDRVKRVTRTVVQVILSAIITIALAIVALAQFAPQVLAALADILPPEVYAWLAGAVAFLVALAGALARVMAIPQVNAFLVKLGLGTAPKSLTAPKTLT